MRDIGARIQRYRLSRYGRVGGATFRWAWPLLFVWLVYAAFLGQHSLLRIWLMGNEERRVQERLADTRAELNREEHMLHDKALLKNRGEHVLRERNGFARTGELIYRIPEADSLRD
jgi:cell division protein FtsB